MHKHKSSRTSKISNKFEPGTLSQRSLNNIDESWKVISNLKTGMRDLEDKLNRYSDNIKLLSSISNNSLNTTLNSTLLPPEKKASLFTSTSFNSALKPSLYNKSPSKYRLTENSILENSYLSSTIQACDPSFVRPGMNRMNYSSCDINMYDLNPDIRCLNDFSSHNLNTSSLNINYKPKEINKHPKTTKVDIYVPSDIPSSQRVDSSSKKASMIPKEKLTRKTSSDTTKRSASEEVKYADFIQPGSSSFLQQQQRILHRDNDLLPISSNSTTNITKRHLSSASFNNAIESNRYHDFVKPPSRKIAFPSSKHTEMVEHEDLIKNINPLPMTKMNVKEETDRLLGLTSGSFNNKKQKKSDHNFDPNQFNSNKSNGIITTSSWRLGEAIAQKHVKQHVQEPDKNIVTPYQLQYNPRSSSAPVNQSPQSAKKARRTECHLVQNQTSKPPKSISGNVSSPQLNKNKQKPYDLNDIHKYIQSQKSKRLHETKSEKEKQKIQDEERKKKLQELYRKQRLQAIKSAQTGSNSKLNNSNENKLGSQNNSANNSIEKTGVSKLYEQDMSKMLMDRISHLLNDNDKLVEKQRKQIQNEKQKMKKKVDFSHEDTEHVDGENDHNESSTSSTTSASTVNNSISSTPKKTTQQKASNAQNMKHDRLKKICSMALDLQTKLQQTKLKLFGYNPNDEEEDLIDYYKKPDNTFITSTKHEINDEDNEQNFIDESNLIQFDRVFKQDVRENNVNFTEDTYDFNAEETTRPGIGNIRSFKHNLTPDLAARRIQHAYRLHLAKRKANLVRKPSKKTTVKKENVKPGLKTDQIMALNNQKDGYNFLSVYKKKSGLGALSSIGPSLPVNSVAQPSITKTKIETNNYTDEFITYNDTRLIETEKLSTIKSTSSSASSSSESTSLSKYITNSKSSKQVKPSRSIEIQQVMDESNDNTSGTSSSTSASSTSTLTSSYTKPIQNNSKIKSIRTEPTSTVSILQKPKTRIVHDYADSKEPRRYSPASLERLLNAGINYLDTLNTSALQLEELDKIRCIGFAQQDTVALAHYLKDKQTNKADPGVKNERSGKSRSSSLASNSSSSSSSASTTVSSSSYNETESDVKNIKSSITTSKKLSEQTRSKHRSSFTNHKELEQDISMINTISELNDTKTDTRIRTEIDDEEAEMEKSFRQVLPSEMHIKKNRQEHKELKDQSLYDLSQSSFCSQYDVHPTARLSFEDDSFKKFTGEIVKKYMQEEELRSKHQADLLKIREKALIEKTKSELAWLEQMKKKAKDKGEDEKMPLILRKEKGIIQKLKQEQDNINKMKEVQRKATENRLKLLSQHSEVVKWCQNKLKQQSLNLSQTIKTAKNEENDEISTASTLASTASSSSSSSSTTTSNPSTHVISTSIANNQEGDQLDESSLNLNNQSLIESKIMKQFQHLSSEKYLTEREKKLRSRRKHAEEIIAWKRKLDEEELKVREIEKQANQVLKEKPKQQSPKTKEAVINKGKKNLEKSGKREQEDEFDDREDEIATEIVQTESKLAPISTKTIATSINNENSYADSFESTGKSTLQNIKSRSQLNKKNKDDSQSNVIKTSIANSISTQLNESSSRTDHRDDDTTKESSSSSISETNGTTVSSSTSTSVRELEIKVKELKNEYLKKRNEAEKLGKMLKEAEKMKMKEKEEQLRKKIESYDNKLERIKSALNQKSKEIPQKLESRSEIRTEEIFDENSSLSSTSTSSTPTSHDAKSSSISTKQITTQKYDEEFESEKPTTKTNSRQSSTSTSSSSKEVLKVESEKEEQSKLVKKFEDEEKSTISEISEDLIGNSTSQNNMKLDGLDDLDDNSNSSNDTQILILGSSRQSKEKDQSKHEIEKFRRQDMAIQNFVKTYLDDLIDQMIEIRNIKSSKMLAEQYKETLDKLNEDKEPEEDYDYDENKEEDKDDLLLTQNVKIPIPPIDLDEDFEEESKVKKLNDSKNETLKPPVFNVPFSREKISHLVDLAVENYYWNNLSQLKKLLDENYIDESNNLANNEFLKEFFEPETEGKDIEYNFKKMVLDLTGELIYDLFLENYEEPELISEFLPGHKKSIKKKHFKSYFKGPTNLEKVKELVKEKILSLLKLTQKDDRKEKTKSKWRVQKKLDLVDGLLDVEMREQEHEWSNYEIEEFEARLLVSNTIFDMLLKDTLDCVQLALIKKKS